MGVDPSSDEIVLMKIMEVLRTLMLSKVGLLLTNESVCEIMQSTFRICFENRLSELLRKTAEHSLNDMIQLLFTRLPTFSEENLPLLKKLKMRNHGESGRSRRKHHLAAGGSKSRTKPAASPARQVQQSQAAQQVTEDSTAPKSLPPMTSTPESNKEKLASPSTPRSNETVSMVATSSPVATAVTSDDSALASSPTLTSNPSEQQFSIDHDVLARSPMGSVCDLTAVQSDGESQGGPESLPPVTAEKPEEPSTAIEKQHEVEKVQPIEEQSSSQGVGITVTSPKGTVTEVAEEKQDKTVKAAEENGVQAEDKEVALEVSKSTTGGLKEEFVNSQGVTFTPTTDMVDETGSLVPYGLPCVRELFRFLISLINPHDSHNHDSMIQIALSLLATALETGADSLDKFESLLILVKDDLARNLVSLLSAERIATFSATLWLSYIIIESQRKHLKYQLEIFFNKLNDIVCSESQKVTYEHKELALDMVVRMYRMPGFITQLYLNFDCDMYTSNTFEDLTKMLSKNAFPVTGLYSTHFLSLDALLTVIEMIETQCQKRILAGNTKSNGLSAIKGASIPTPEAAVSKSSGHQFGVSVSANKLQEENQTAQAQASKIKIPTHEEVMALKHKKKLITTATEQFNTKPAKGVTYMQECGLLKTSPEPHEIASFLRQNPHLDKKQLGEYVSNRKNLVILEAFCQSFDFCGVRIDEALRQFLEAFRLPGKFERRVFTASIAVYMFKSCCSCSCCCCC